MGLVPPRLVRTPPAPGIQKKIQLRQHSCNSLAPAPAKSQSPVKPLRGRGRRPLRLPGGPRLAQRAPLPVGLWLRAAGGPGPDRGGGEGRHSFIAGETVARPLLLGCPQCPKGRLRCWPGPASEVLGIVHSEINNQHSIGMMCFKDEFLVSFPEFSQSSGCCEEAFAKSKSKSKTCVFWRQADVVRFPICANFFPFQAFSPLLRGRLFPKKNYACQQ